MRVLCVGAGLSSAVIANKLAESGCLVIVYESRNHVAGNCYMERDSETGIMLHRYGPHIFHTNDREVWDFVNAYAEFKPYVNRVKTVSKGRVYSLPINLHTINQFFEKTFGPAQALSYIESMADSSITNPASFEEQALRFVGKDLYEAFFKGYTRKQWGVEPSKLPATILKRLPLRFNYDDNYFNHKYQGIPINGYNEIVEKLLSHPNITVMLDTEFSPRMAKQFDHVFFSGRIDSYFDYRFGCLSYRTLDFYKEVHEGDYQGTAVMNYADEEVPYTRITEHKHFTPWEMHRGSVIYKEYSRDCKRDDVPYYPVRLRDEKSLLKKYVTLANATDGVSFIGRLGTYMYLDMDVTIRKSLDAAATSISLIKSGKPLPAFFESME